MKRAGLVVNVGGSHPERAELETLGPSYLRTIVYRFEDLERFLDSMPDDIRMIALLNSETEGVGHDYGGWEPTVEEFVRRFHNRVHAVECANEWDLLGLPADLAAWLVETAHRPLRDAGMLCLLGSVAGPDWQGQLSAAMARVDPRWVDGVSFHPYGRRAGGIPENWGFGELDEGVWRTHELSGKPVYLTEFGIKIGDARGEDGQAVYVRRAFAALERLPADVLGAACYFAWSDSIGAPSERGEEAFGLRREDGSARSAWDAFRTAARGTVPLPPAPEPPPITPEVPVMATKYLVGAGVLDKMAERGDEPATDEIYHAGARQNAQYSETFGKSGTRYVWVRETNSTLLFSPTT